MGYEQFWVAAKLLPLMVLLAATNPGLPMRARQMAALGEWIGVVQWIAEWIIAAAALFVISAHDSLLYRGVWGMAVAFSGSSVWLFHRLTRCHPTALAAAEVWASRNGLRAVSQAYKWPCIWAALLGISMVLVLVAPPPPALAALLKAHSHVLSPWLPLLSVLLILGEHLIQKGNPQTPMPTQFSLLSILPLAAFYMARGRSQKRGEVPWAHSGSRKSQNIIVLVDESIRGDHVSIRPGNALTPKLARFETQFVDFGVAVSGSNASTASNRILRFGTVLSDLKGWSRRNPSLFRYAKLAGYRTVYINSQSMFLDERGGAMELTLDEILDVDAIHTVHSWEQADYDLADIVARELASPGPVFIYANKAGAHIPYEWNYPAEAGSPRNRSIWQTRVQAGDHAAYRKAIAWNVEGFFLYLFEKAGLGNSTLIYTSDHGQQLLEGEFTHGQARNAPAQTALVPLWVYSADAGLQARFEEGARASRGRASHFQIAPALYELMGYNPADIAKVYSDTLFTGATQMPRMLTGDIFGLFGEAHHEAEIDPTRDYYEGTPKPA